MSTPFASPSDTFTIKRSKPQDIQRDVKRKLGVDATTDQVNQAVKAFKAEDKELLNAPIVSRPVSTPTFTIPDHASDDETP